MNTKDQVEMFQTFRYISAGEAFFRSVDYDLSRNSVGTTRLGTHLPGQDWVGVASDNRDSTLLTYFNRPAAPEMEGLLYAEYYSRFSLDTAKAHEVASAAACEELPFKPPRGNAYYIDTAAKPNKVALRNPGSLHVARIYGVPVTKGEAYYVRLLVTRVAARSFEDLRTHTGTLYDTFREAAEARGLLTMESEYMDALAELAQDHLHVRPSELRNTFAMMVLHGGETVPVLSMYERFKYAMALDIDNMGRVRAVGQDLNPGGARVYHRLAVCAFDPEEAPPDMDEYVVHEYHLLRMLGELIAKNSTRTLEDVGLPTLAQFAGRKHGGAVPVLQRHLEEYLYVSADIEAPTGATLEHVALLRAEYVSKYPELLTGEALGALAGAERQRRRNRDPTEAFFADVNREAQAALHSDMYATLNREQLQFVDRAVAGLLYQEQRMRALREGGEVPDPPEPNSRYLHLQARGGRGKSYVNMCIIAKALSLGLMVSVSAFSGVAAILLPHGQTCHRTYGLLLDVSEPQPSMLTTRSAQGLALAHTALHIIDECDYLHRNLFIAASDITTRCVNAVWRQSSEEAFGGAMVVVSGDMHQSLPVIRGIVNDDATVYSLMRSTDLFAGFSSTVLTLAQRSKGDKRYDKWLGLLSVNRAPGPEAVPAGAEPPTARKVFIPESCFSTCSVAAALEWLHGPPPPPGGPFPALNPLYGVLCTLNSVVDEINDLVLDQYVEGDVFLAEATHSKPDDSAGNEDKVAHVFTSEEYMRSQEQSGVPSATLRLKTGAILILTRNMLASLGLMNGTKLRLLSVAPARGYLSVLTVETIPAAGQEAVRHSLPRIAFPMVTKGGMKFTRRQFPVRLAYAMSCQKSQGQTLHRVVMDTRHEPFAHGTAYVSCSRTREFAALGFLHAPAEDGSAPTFVNVVLQRVLQAEGVLRAAGPPALRLVEVDESGASSDEGAPAAPAQRRARRQKGEAAPASKQKHALSLRARREALSDMAQVYREQ